MENRQRLENFQSQKKKTFTLWSLAERWLVQFCLAKSCQFIVFLRAYSSFIREKFWLLYWLFVSVPVNRKLWLKKLHDNSLVACHKRLLIFPPQSLCIKMHQSLLLQLMADAVKLTFLCHCSSWHLCGCRESIPNTGEEAHNCRLSSQLTHGVLLISLQSYSEMHSCQFILSWVLFSGKTLVHCQKVWSVQLTGEYLYWKIKLQLLTVMFSAVEPLHLRFSNHKCWSLTTKSTKTAVKLNVAYWWTWQLYDVSKNTFFIWQIWMWPVSIFPFFLLS